MLYITIGFININQTTFQENSCNKNGFWISESKGFIINSKFYSNTAKYKSANIYISESESFRIDNCIFKNDPLKTNIYATTLVKGNYEIKFY